MSEPKNTLTAKHKIGYALGDMGGCMTFALMGAYVTRYYVNVLKVDTVVLAILLAIWNIWDAVNDPMMGALMDKMFAKHHNPKGKFRPWQGKQWKVQSADHSAGFPPYPRAPSFSYPPPQARSRPRYCREGQVSSVTPH